MAKIQEMHSEFYWGTSRETITLKIEKESGR